jgi:hypothetical protein
MVGEKLGVPPVMEFKLFHMAPVLPRRQGDNYEEARARGAVARLNSVEVDRAGS